MSEKTQKIRLNQKVLYLLLLLIPLGTGLIYVHTLDYPFTFDDLWNIKGNENVHMTDLSPESIKNALLGHNAHRQRPITNLSFGMNHYFSGLSASAFRLTNLIIHAINGLLLFGCLNLMFKKVNRPAWLAALAALLWTVHPVQSQAVILIHQRSTSLAVLFYLFSMLCFLWARSNAGHRGKIPALILCALSAALAFGSKEIAFMILPTLFLVEWVFFQNMSGSWFKRKIIPATMAAIVLLAICALYLRSNYSSWLGGTYNLDPDIYGPEIRLLTQSRVVVIYISLLLWPHPSRLNLDHHAPFSSSLFDPATTLWSILLITFLLATMIFAAVKGRKLVFTGLAWFFLHHIIESTIIPLEQIYEHRVYLPAIGWSILAASGLYGLWNRSRPAMLLLCATCVITMGTWTYQRGFVWENELTLWKDCATKSPGKSRTRHNLGNAYQADKQFEKALDEYNAAVAINPTSAQWRFKKGVAHFILEQHDEAIQAFEACLALKQGFYRARFYLARTYQKTNQPEKALKEYQKYLKHKPRHVISLNNIGNILLKAGNIDAAIEHYQLALQYDPTFDKARQNLAIALKIKHGQQ